MSRIAECEKNAKELIRLLKQDPSMLKSPLIKPLAKELLDALLASSGNGPSVALSYDDVVDVSCKMQDAAPNCGYSQGHLEYLLIKGIKETAGVDFFQEEARRCSETCSGHQPAPEKKHRSQAPLH